MFKIDATGTETVLYSFTGKNGDGQQPFSGLIRDPSGNLYGTTQNGGSSNSCFSGCGTVFKLDKFGKMTVLHSFAGGSDGATPLGGLILDRAGNLYGTTFGGGGGCGFGCGIVFKMDPAGNKTALHTFTGPDGRNPRGALIRDSAGNLYGTTYAGGAHGGGTVFKLDTTGQVTVLYSFAGNLDGERPTGGLVRDGAGNLFGTTSAGGPRGTGTLFKIDPTGKETILHVFINNTEGSEPSSLVRDAAGNFYGTTFQGGGDRSCNVGCGTVFKFSLSGSPDAHWPQPPGIVHATTLPLIPSNQDDTKYSDCRWRAWSSR